MAAALGRLYLREAAEIAQVALKDTTTADQRRMLRTRLRTRRQQLDGPNGLAVAEKERRLLERLAEHFRGQRRRFPGLEAERDVDGLRAEELRVLLERELVADFAAAYFDFNDGRDRQENGQERQQWTAALLTTLSLYHEEAEASGGLGSRLWRRMRGLLGSDEKLFLGGKPALLPC
jgi:hypothetical protein